MSTTTTAVTCPSCGANVSAPSNGSTAKCGYCGTDVVIEGPGRDGPTEFPHFSWNPIPCPACHKKALRPRVRTKDFRCQACSRMFPRQEIEDLAASIPKRRWVTPAEREGALYLLTDRFKWYGDRDYSWTDSLKEADLHPDDAVRVLKLYEQAVAVPMEVGDIARAMAEGTTLYTASVGGFAIKAPKRAKDALGVVKNWDELRPDERAEALAQHRNEAIATFFANRDRAARAIQRELGCSLKAAARMAEKILGGEMHVGDIRSPAATSPPDVAPAEKATRPMPRKGLPAVLWLVVVGVLAIGGWSIATVLVGR